MLSRQQIPAVFAKARAAQAKGLFEAAREQYALILAAAPGLAEVHFNLAQIAFSEGDSRAAFRSFEKAAQCKPKEPAIWEAWIKAAQDVPEELSRLRKALAKSGLPAKSKTALMAATKGSDLETALDRIGKLYAARDYVSAERLIAQLDRKGENSALFLYWKGRLAALRKDDRAVRWLDAAFEAGLNTADLHFARALANAMARRDDAALAAIDMALELAPDRPDLLAEKAEQLQNRGDFEGARAQFRRALEHEPDSGLLYLRYFSTGRVPEDDPVRDMLKSAYVRNKDRDMAMALSKITPPKESFAYVKEANAQTRRLFGYGFAADQKEAARVRKSYTDTVHAQWSASADPRARPIFVTGLPRSGTTLVEQIIAAHSQVASGGELALAGKLLGRLPNPPTPSEARERYWDILTARFPGVAAVTDKSISSYVHIGYLKALFPNSRIIVVRRDPRDNALSLFKNKFRDGMHRYSNDLGDIARFIRLFEAQVAFWQDVCPDDFAEVTYEELIAQPEPVSRRLIAVAGLEWEDACLSFYDSGARVDTLSNVQVRQPIYSASIGGWRHVEEEMKPFLDVYGDMKDA